jgi:hypothetical protein
VSQTREVTKSNQAAQWERNCVCTNQGCHFTKLQMDGLLFGRGKVQSRYYFHYCRHKLIALPVGLFVYFFLISSRSMTCWLILSKSHFVKAPWGMGSKVIETNWEMHTFLLLPGQVYYV